MRTRLRLWLAISCVLLALVAGSASVPSKNSLGIAPHDESYYVSSVIKCKDGSKKFTKDQLNDDFCDCPDGTDEPGTSACPEGKFYCQNTGHFPLTIFSSRVNDGICDCCDGSDEYDGKANCPNTCWEAGKVAREKLIKKIGTFQEGVAIRKQEVEKAKQAFAKDEAELSKLKNEENILKGLVQNLKEHKERIEKAEEEERRRKEEDEKKLKEAEEKASSYEKPSKGPHDEMEGAPGPGEASESMNQVTENHEKTFVDSETSDNARNVEASPSIEKHLAEDQDEIIDGAKTNDKIESNEVSFNHEVEQELEGSANTEGLSKEELGRLVASRWTGEHVEQKAHEVDNYAKEEKLEDDEATDSTKEEYDGGYDTEAEEDKYKFDDEGIEGSDDENEEDHVGVGSDGSYNPDEDYKTDSSDPSSSSQSWLDKIQQSVQNILQTFNLFRTPVNISEAARVRKEYDDSSSKLSKIQSRISRLTEKLKHEYGKDKEFYSFHDQCFENKQNKYVYKVCPFKQASQVEGHSTTQLGHWDKFEDSHRVMLFSRGDRCWNGPDRSLKVRLRCGLKNELFDVDEPSRCEYVALMSTPALCVEEKLKELQQKLEQMNSGQPLSHDEL